MGLVGLHQYLDRIEELLEARRVEEASAHCQHILEQEPRHLDSMRLLGRIFLEQQNFEDALRIFVHVLRVDPEDLVAHAGRGLAYKEKGDFARAIWHMERAAEIDSYNSSVQVELANLYRVAGDRQPQKRNLILAAMARLNVIGGRYEQAESELQEVIKISPDRYDLKVLLAETLFLDKKVEESAKTSSKILKVLPDCIKPNAILGLAYLQFNKKQSARQIASRLGPILRPEKVTLDKDSLSGKFLLSFDQQAIPERIMVRELETPSNGSRSGNSSESTKLSPQKTIAKAGVPSWLASEKGEAAQEARRKEEIDSIDDVILWLEAIAAEEGSLFESEPNSPGEQPKTHNQANEVLRTSRSLARENLENETNSAVADTMIAPPNQAAESLVGKQDDLISTIDYEDALPRWLDEVISFTDNLSLSDQKSYEGKIENNQPMLDAAVAGGIMASLLIDKNDSHTLAKLEDRNMSERNEYEPEEPEETSSFSADDDWLEELSKTTSEELDSTKKPGDADVDDLGDIAPGEEIPDWLAEDLKSVDEAETAAEEDFEPSLTADLEVATLDAKAAEEEGLDWLDQLAAADVQPGGDKESEIPTSEDSSDISILASEIPEDPDEAIAWLEQLAEQEDDSGTILTGMPSDAGEGAIGSEFGYKMDSDSEQVDPLKMPTDEGQAAEWLEEIVATSFSIKSEEQFSEPMVIAEIATPQAPMDVAAAKAEAERIMIEDMDKPTDERIDSSVSDESVETDYGQDQILDWLDDLDITDDVGEAEKEITYDDQLISDSILIEDEVEVPEVEEDLDWLESIDVQEEEEAPEETPHIEESEIEETVMAEMPEMIEEESISVDLDEKESIDEVLPDEVEDESNLFSVAETALKDGNVDEAVVNYKVILASKENLPDLIAALESAVDQYENQPALKRLLGDAYTENGQLQKALEMYRKALEDI